MGIIEKTYTVFAVVILGVGIIFSLERALKDKPDAKDIMMQHVPILKMRLNALRIIM